MGTPAAHRNPLTAQQRHAVEARAVSVVLSSGAGCGKTHVLTERYLSHLRADGAEVGQVVAITFTDRAARQMRQRIRAAVVQELKTAVAEDEAERWARHLRGLESAQISTIHAFCGTLLRQNAVAAGLDPRFEVLEDVLAANLEAEALTTCLQRLLTAQTEAGMDLRELVLLYGWRAVVEAVQGLLRARDVPEWSRWLAQPDESSAAAWRNHARTAVLPRFVRYLTAADARIARCLWLLRRTPPLPSSKIAVSVQRLLDETPRLAEAPNPTIAAEEMAELAKVGSERAKAWPSEAVYEAVRDAFKDFRDTLRAQPFGLFTQAPDDLAAAVRVGRRFLHVANEAAEDYRDLKRRNSVVDFQDLLVLARDLLREQPAIRERLQQRYHFLLIDELQDTDPVQMELVESLCGGGLTAGKLFAVGDHSQAIYKFRGADVQLFRSLRESVPHAGRLGLTLNFRSQPAILDFANALLGHRLEDYEPLEPHQPQVNPGPCVEFLWSTRGEEASVTEARSCEAGAIARRIAALVAGECLVVERGADPPALRPVRPGDVVLLFRAMSNVHLYEAALRRHGLHYYLVGGRAFFAQQEIYDLLNLLRALENPQDGVSLAGTLRAPFCCLSDEALFVLGRHKQGLWAGLHDPETWTRLPRDQRAPVERARDHLDRWRSLKDRLPIARLLGAVFADSGFDAATQFEFLGDRKLANLWKLVDLARMFDRSGLFGLADFIRRLGDLVRLQPREEQAATQPENADVVRLLSIHQAKGLEFPIVFVPDLGAITGGSYPPVARWDARLGCLARPPADEETPPFPDYGWQVGQIVEKVEDWHEDLRTLYVACTRAQDYLVLSAALKEPFSPTNAWTLTLAERFDLRTGACLAGDVPPERMPKVRVTVATELPVRSVAAEQTRRAEVVHDTEPFDAAAVAPIPVWLSGKRIFTLVEIERYLQANDVRPEQAAPQFDTEDGADRGEWFSVRDTLSPATCLRERILRSVLEQWDDRDVGRWPLLLAEAITARAAPGEAERLRADVEPLLARFAASELCRELSEATVVQRDVEFLLDWPHDEGLFSPTEPTLLRGIIDCLWQDAAGAWHLAAFVTDDRDRMRELVVWSMAVQRRWGAWPEYVTVCDFRDGTTKRLPVQRLPHQRVQAELSEAISALRRTCLAC